MTALPAGISVHPVAGLKGDARDAAAGLEQQIDGLAPDEKAARAGLASRQLTIR